MPDIVGVRFQRGGPVRYFDAAGLELAAGAGSSSTTMRDSARGVSSSLPSRWSTRTFGAPWTASCASSTTSLPVPSNPFGLTSVIRRTFYRFSHQ